MQTLRTESEASGLPPCVLVPTMGALHEGHLALIRLGVREARRRGLPGGCVVSIFVNPAQFNDPADFERYPRALEADLRACESQGAIAVFAPAAEEVYPPRRPAPQPKVPPVGREPGLEDRGRPGHFEGVCRVLMRLFEMVPCRGAVFGEKDWQQLQLARALVAQERLDVDIIAGPTVREADGLAMSSRNAHLSPAGRERALAIHRALAAAQGHETPRAAEAAMREVLLAAPVERIDYAAVRHAETLMPLDEGELAHARARALITAYVDGTRLLDNAPWREPRPAPGN